jgi:hypothetical protein
MDHADIAREALEEIRAHLGAALKHVPYLPAFDVIVLGHIDASHGIADRAARRLDRAGCPETLRGARAA